MTTKEQIIQELEQVPEGSLDEVLRLIRTLKEQPSESRADRVWQAYLESVQEREEVYRRLASS
jgi:uncharacterized protein YqgV (UPF0045/DUF77 family)